jgi:hypothetical protein
MSAHSEDEYEKVYQEFLDCNGDPFCMEYNVLKTEEPELKLAPDFTPVDWGSVEFYWTPIVKSLEYDKFYNALLTLQYPLPIGTIFATSQNRVQYYIKRFVKRTPKNHYVYEIKRADCSELVLLDFSNLVEKRRVYRKGFFHEK